MSNVLGTTSSHVRDMDGNYLEGHTNLPSLQIKWKGQKQPQGVEALTVLQETERHLNILQQSRQSSNANAKAIWHIMEAIKALQTNPGSAPGSSQPTLPPIPRGNDGH